MGVSSDLQNGWISNQAVSKVIDNEVEDLKL